MYTGEPPGHGQPHWHAGQDYALPEPTQLYAALAGRVTEKDVGSRPGHPGGYGAQSIRFALDGDQHDVILGHLESSPAVGTYVVEGQPLARSGGGDNDDGNSSGAHLHFEVRTRGAGYGGDVDPTPWLNPVVPTDDTEDDELAYLLV